MYRGFLFLSRAGLKNCFKQFLKKTG